MFILFLQDDQGSYEEKSSIHTVLTCIYVYICIFMYVHIFFKIGNHDLMTFT